MRRRPPAFTSSAAASTKTSRPCSSRPTVWSPRAATRGRPRLPAASPCSSCPRARRPSRGPRALRRPAGASKSYASSGSTRGPEGGTEMAQDLRVEIWMSFERRFGGARPTATAYGGVDRVMDRRRFIRACAGSMVIARSGADAQSASKAYRVGYLTYATPEQAAPLLRELTEGLRELGYVEGQNIIL